MADQMRGKTAANTCTMSVCNDVHCNEHGDHHQKHPLMQITEGKKKAKNASAAKKEVRALFVRTS